MTAIAFGPVSSRRLGRSLGINVRDGRLARREHAGRTFFVMRFARPAPVAAASATPERVR